MTKHAPHKKTLILLDAHAIIHRAYHALPDFSSSSGEPTGGLYGVTAMIIRIVKEFSPEYLVGCFDLPQPTFRHHAYGEYKMGRAKADDALISQIERSRDLFAALGIPVYDAPGFEADDVLATIVESLKDNDDVDIIIASGDMDTLQLVSGKRVRVFTLKKGLNDTVLYDEDAVRARFGFPPALLPDWKGFRGDPSDNIPGIKGIGEKTATTLVTAFGPLEELYETIERDKDALAAAGVKARVAELVRSGKDEAMFSKTLATVRRDAPISFSLPAASWRETLDLAAADNFFSEVEFRGMGARLRDALGSDVIDRNESVPVPTAPETRRVESRDIGAFREARIARWLLSSDMTNPSEEEILSFTRTSTLSDALVVLRTEVERAGVGGVLRDIELPLIPIIEAAQTRGIGVDKGHFAALSRHCHGELERRRRKVIELAGQDFNINSPKQLGEVLFDRLHLSAKGLKKTAGGARSTRESELRKLEDVHPVVAEVLAYRELQKLLSTYIDVVPQLADENGRVHSTLNQTGTTTGRMSSNDPNLQNIPSGTGVGMDIRKGFIAAPGFMFAAFDYSQIEMRVLAELSGDEKLRDIFRNGEDVHAAVAAYMYGVPESGVTKEMRRRAKVINFGIIYGMGVNALRENLGTDRKEAEAFYNNYFEKFPAIAAYFDDVKALARKNGYTETLFGRRRYFANLRSRIPYVRAAAERMAMNAPVQGTAADLIKIAMKRADDAIHAADFGDAAHLLLQIHDELLYEVREDAVKLVVPVIREAMEHAANLSVPLSVNIATGKTLGDMEPYEPKV